MFFFYDLVDSGQAPGLGSVSGLLCLALLQNEPLSQLPTFSCHNFQTNDAILKYAFDFMMLCSEHSFKA